MGRTARWNAANFTGQRLLVSRNSRPRDWYRNIAHLQAEVGGGGGTVQNFVRGGFDPRSNHLLSNAFINMSFLQKKYSFRIPFTYYL